jgi:hypothetical protein
MPYPILGTPKPQFFDSSGAPLASGTLSVLDPATNLNKASYPTYDDAVALTNANTNPITLDSRGEPANELWGLEDEDYKLVLKDSTGNIIWTVDDVQIPIIGWATSNSEGDASVTPSNTYYMPGYIERYGGVADGTTDSTTALETANSVGRQNVLFYETGRTDVLNTYTGRHRFYIIRDAFVDRANLIGPANFASNGTQTESILRLGRDPDNTNGTQWRFRKVEGINFSGKQRADNAISFGADDNYPNNFALAWSIERCFFERCNIAIKKATGNFGNHIRYCSASSGNFGYWAQGYPIQGKISSAEASGQTVISVDDTNGMNANDVVRILMDDATIHKTTIVSVDSATQITIAVATDDTAAVGNYVKAYHPDDAVPATLSHVGSDYIVGGEWAGNRKAAFYINGENNQGAGQTVLQSCIIENNPGFGIFVKDYNNAYTVLTLNNCWFESNGKDASGYTGTVDLGDGQGAREPQDIYFENVDNAKIFGSQMRLCTFIDSAVHIDQCTFESALTELIVTNTDNLNNIRITNAHISAWGEDRVGAKDVVIESVARVLRELGDAACRMWRTPQLTPISMNEPHEGTVIESDTGDNGVDWIGVDPAADVARDGFVEGNTYATASQYTYQASSTYIAPAVMAAEALTQDKWYVATMELKVDANLANLDSLKFGSGYNLTRGSADGLLTEGEWATIGVVGLLDANHQAGTIRPMITTTSGGTCQISWGATQIVEFDKATDAYDFYNRNVHVFQHKSSKRLRRTDSAAKTNSTLADDTELMGWNLQADTWYQVEGFISLDTDATADWIYNFDFTSAAQNVFITAQSLDNIGNIDNAILETGDASEDIGGRSDQQAVIFNGHFKSNATTGGTVDFQWAQRVPDAYNTKILEGSWIRISKMHDED